MTTGDFFLVASGATELEDLVAHPSLLADQSVKGWMIVTNDDPNGSAQASILSGP
jgi:hypothetical protein